MVNTKASTKNFATKNVAHQTAFERNVKHFEMLSKAEEEKVINLYDALVSGDNKRPIDIKMIVTEAFPKFEETIGQESFAKVKRYFGIGCKPNQKNIRESEIKILIAKLKTIENAQYYITGYKELVKKVAEKLLNAPESMETLVKAKLIRMFFIVLHDNEFFLEDYDYIPLPNGKTRFFFSEKKALSNNKMFFSPEQMFNIFDMKVRNSEGFYYDMMVIYFKRMCIDYQTSKKYKQEIQELLEFAELKYDFNTDIFTSVNKVMSGATFSKIRSLKKKIFEVQPQYPLSIFCDKRLLEETVDITDLYVIYKTLRIGSFTEESLKTAMKTHKSLSGSRYVDVQQCYYEICDGFFVADDSEAQRWITLFEYLAAYDIVLKTSFDGNGGTLPEVEYYNVGALSAAISYAMEVGYLNASTMVIRDFEIAKKLLTLEGAEELFLKFKRMEVSVEEMRNLLGIDEEFEDNVLKIEKIISPEERAKCLVQTIIKLALNNGYAKCEEDIDSTLVENIFIPGNEENIEKFSNGQISASELEKRIGFETEFAEGYFNTSKIDVNIVEAKLQDIKKSGRKELVRKSKLLISLYCYVVKNGIPCGPKHKPAKRNKGLKPEILESLIA